MNNPQADSSLYKDVFDTRLHRRKNPNYEKKLKMFHNINFKL